MVLVLSSMSPFMMNLLKGRLNWLKNANWATPSIRILNKVPRCYIITFYSSVDDCLSKLKQIDQTQLSKILGLVKEGVFQGAKLVYGGNRHGDLGYYVQPTVLADVEDHHVVASKEV